MHKAKLSLAVLTVIICAVAVLLLVRAYGEDWPWDCTLGKENTMTINASNDVYRARAIRPKYDPLFWRQPNVHGVGIGDIQDGSGEWTGKWGFVVHVTEKVDQSTLPPEDRIPDCLEGVPVEIREEPIPVLY